MSKIVKASKGSYQATLVLQDGDLAILNLLKNKTQGSVPLSITGASVDGDMIFIARKDGMYEVKKSDLFR